MEIKKVGVTKLLGVTISRHKVRPKCRHRRQMVGVLQCLLIQIGRQENGCGQAKRSKPDQSPESEYRVTDRLVVKAGRMVRQAG